MLVVLRCFKNTVRPVCPPGLQSHMAALERDLVEEKERCRVEKQRRREVHNALVVRVEITHLYSTLWFNCGSTSEHRLEELHIQGLQYPTRLSNSTYNKLIRQKKAKQQYISVGTVRMFIEPSAKH